MVVSNIIRVSEKICSIIINLHNLPNIFEDFGTGEEGSTCETKLGYRRPKQSMLWRKILQLGVYSTK